LACEETNNLFIPKENQGKIQSSHTTTHAKYLNIIPGYTLLTFSGKILESLVMGETASFLVASFTATLLTLDSLTVSVAVADIVESLALSEAISDTFDSIAMLAETLLVVLFFCNNFSFRFTEISPTEMSVSLITIPDSLCTKQQQVSDNTGPCVVPS